MLNIETKVKKKIISKKGCQKRKKFIKQRKISEIIKKGTLQATINGQKK